MSIETASSINATRANLVRAAGPALVAAVFAVLAAWSWRRWADAAVDFGQELYVPWRINQGEVLGRDIMVLYGPFSKYVNALLFRLFGTSLTTLIFANLAIALALILLVHAVIARVCDRLTAAATCVILLALCVFPHYGGVGNFNFICPYSQEAVHGLVLTVVMILLLWRFAQGAGYCLPALAGLCLGAVALTKTEIAVAAEAAAGTGLALMAAGPERNPAKALRAAAAMAGGLVIAPLFFLGFLGFQEGLPAAARTVAGSWVALFGSKMTSNIFWTRGMGLDQPGLNLLKMGGASLGVLVLAALAGLADYLLAKAKWRKPVWAVGGLAALALAVIYAISNVIPWLDLPRFLPDLCAASALAGAAAVVMKPSDPGRRLWLAAVWSVFALAMLGRMVLNTRLYDFGFYLALPAVALTGVILIHVLPAALRERYGGGTVFRGLALAALAAVTLHYLGRSRDWYAAKDYAIGRGGDTILFYGPDRTIMGEAFNQALSWIETNTPSDSTLVCLPGGAMLNYLARRDNPTPYLSFLIGELQTFGEQTMVASLRERPPDFILIAYQPAEAFGFLPFGRDPRYGRAIMTWVGQNYREVWARGPDPARGNSFGIKIMEWIGR